MALMYKLLKLNNSTNSTLFQGQAYGHDLVGPFYHHSGPFGPFGFYANFFHEKWTFKSKQKPWALNQ